MLTIGQVDREVHTSNGPTKLGIRLIHSITSYPIFKKSPHFTPPNYAKRQNESSILYAPSAFSPTGVPLQVSYPNFYQPISKFFKHAFTSLGLRNIAGLNSGNLLGFSEFTLSIDPQAETRSSSETSFLQDAISTSILQFYQQTLAKKILFDRSKTATGVEVVTAGTGYRLYEIHSCVIITRVLACCLTKGLKRTLRACCLKIEI